MSDTNTKKEIIEAIKNNHAQQIEKSEPVISSYEALQKLLPHLKQDEIIAAIAKMNSVTIIDGMAGSLEFFPTLF
jgi:hypothetical protein